MREEIQNLARERAAARGGVADLPADSLRQGVPRRAVAFLKVCYPGKPALSVRGAECRAGGSGQVLVQALVQGQGRVQRLGQGQDRDQGLRCGTKHCGRRNAPSF